ncbi:MAG: TRAP transporter large permease subunit, partial [Oscillospiraceae bacterium]|nr:TRAP transporter large permease subunit [Oscillospiraceae bacterium]
FTTEALAQNLQADSKAELEDVSLRTSVRDRSLFMNILLLLLGMVLDASPAILLMVPILWPVAMGYGIDSIQFGIIMCLNLMIGNLTPPVGMMLFVISNVGKVSLSRLYRSILPFVGVAVVVLFLVTYVPWMSTFIPNWLMP